MKSHFLIPVAGDVPTGASDFSISTSPNYEVNERHLKNFSIFSYNCSS